MSQKDEADATVKEMQTQITAMTANRPTLESYIVKLDNLLAASQNGPPDGKADGTVSPAKWSALRAYSMSCKQLLASFNALKQ